LVLNALGGDDQAQVGGHHQDRPDDRGALRVVREPGDKGAVDLQAGDRELAEVGEGRVTGAEVIDDQSDADSGQGGQRVAGVARLPDQLGLGQLEVEPAGPRPVLASTASTRSP